MCDLGPTHHFLGTELIHTSAVLSPIELIDPVIYRSAVGAPQYLTITRPNISFAVNRACQSMHNPSINDWARVKPLFRYLKGTIFDSLYFHISVGFEIDRRSTRGYLVYLGKNLISWNCQKQLIVAPNVTAELIEIQFLLHELCIHITVTPFLWCNNIGATFLAVNPVFHACTKHIKIDYHFVRVLVNSKQVKIGFLFTKDQVADILTKPLPKHRFL
ncbi:unnamed protein product [Spirodela intermedia]|uniref:Uncharacterized protein n=1 Tax=Spirodela intermedia TaxID=51605 RepID=A0A7I8IKT1_SPIIN|nr:unnamed protein product [Spirodela intermedia]CAA6658003.1 unnamed protein product [Spirodela intermedia]